MNKVGIGRYVSKHTWLHDIDPRIKLMMNIVLLVVLFLLRSLLEIGVFTGLVVVFYLTLNLSWNYPLKALRYILPLAALVFIFQALLWPPEGVVFYQSNSFNIGQNTIFITTRIVLRLISMLLLATCFTATTKPESLTRAIEDLLWPLKLVKFPVQVIAMVIAIALQFMPTMADYIKKIKESQAARGMDSSSSSLVIRIKGIKSIWIPLLASAFTNAISLGNAMDVRGYDAFKKRSRYVTYKIKTVDLLYVLVAISLLVVSIVLLQLVVLPSWVW